MDDSSLPGSNINQHPDDGAKRDKDERDRKTIRIAAIFGIIEVLSLVLWVKSEDVQGENASLLRWFAICGFLVGAASVAHGLAPFKHRKLSIAGIWIVWICLCVHWCPTPEPKGWQPPELPRGCTNVVLWFGPQSFSETILQASISPTSNGTRFLIKDLPSDWRSGDKIANVPGYNRRRRYEWFRVAAMKETIGGIPIDYPILPVVTNNRLYVYVEIPFQNERRMITMNDDMDDHLTIPPLWDRNYNADANIYEIVTALTNPVLQVVYTKPNEVRVNGTYLIDPTNLLAAWEYGPIIISPRMSISITDTNTGKEVFATNGNFGWIFVSNTIYDFPPLSRPTIFKYPGRDYPGEFANPPKTIFNRVKWPLLLLCEALAIVFFDRRSLKTLPASPVVK